MKTIPLRQADEDERWRFIHELDTSLLRGSVALSEWATFIVREADIAFVGQANLAAVITAMAGIETCLRAECASHGRMTFSMLIDQSPLSDEIKRDIHKVRKFRNRWVHVSNPADDQDLLQNSETYERELQVTARTAISLLRRVIYSNQAT